MSTVSIDHLTGSSIKRLTVIFMAANAVGITTYLLLASRGWRIPQEHGMIPVAGEPFVWALALPVLGVFLLVDAVWCVLLFRHKDEKGVLWWALIGISWLVALGVDFAHH